MCEETFLRDREGAASFIPSPAAQTLAEELGAARIRALAAEAIAAREKAYVPYSDFAVGAALLLHSGETVQGCNIESCSYTPTNCAERTAVFSAISRSGDHHFRAIAVAGGPRTKRLADCEYCAPCGVCRQVLAEFADPEHFLVILARSPEDYLLYTLGELLPLGFFPNSLKG